MHRAMFIVFALVGACQVEADNPLAGPCEEYCVKRNTCDEDVDVESCRQDCIDAAQDCQADEQEQALDDIEACAEESCDEIAVCTIGAELQCHFGI